MHTRVAGPAVASTVSSVPWHSGREGSGSLGQGGEGKPLKVVTGDCVTLTGCSCVVSVFISLCHLPGSAIGGCGFMTDRPCRLKQDY